MLDMTIKVNELIDTRPLNYFLDRLPGQVPKNWELHNSGFLQEVIFPKPDGFIQEVYETRIEGVTPGNYPLREKILSNYHLYSDKGLRNGTLFTLGLMGRGEMIDEVKHIERESLSMGNMWNREYPPEASMTVFVFGLCDYYEQIAMVEGVVEGMKPTNAALISACTITSDNQLVFARRVGSANKKIGIVGGTLNEDEQKLGEGKYKTPNEAMNTEVQEELGIEEHQFEVRLQAILSDRIINDRGIFPRPVLFYDVNLDLNKRQVENAFNGDENVKREHSELIFVPNTIEGILGFMKDHDPNELHPPADAVLSVALERATGIRVI